MPQPLRLEFPGAVHHVTSRGDRRAPIYRDNADHDEAIVPAYCDAGFTMSAIARQMGLSVSRVSRILSMAEAKGKTWPCLLSHAVCTLPALTVCR